MEYYTNLIIKFWYRLKYYKLSSMRKYCKKEILAIKIYIENNWFLSKFEENISFWNTILSQWTVISTIKLM